MQHQWSPESDQPRQDLVEQEVTDVGNFRAGISTAKDAAGRRPDPKLRKPYDPNQNRIVLATLKYTVIRFRP